MVSWGPLQRKLLAYLMRHPQFKAAVENATNKVKKSEAFKKAEQKMSSTFEKASKSFNDSSAKMKNSTGSGNDSSSSMFNTIKKKFLYTWQTHKGRIFAFVTANFFGIIILIQLSQPLFHFFASLFQATPHASIKENKKHEKDASFQSRMISQEEGSKNMEGEVEENNTKRQSRRTKRNNNNNKEPQITPKDKTSHDWDTSVGSASMYDDTNHQHKTTDNMYNSDMYRDIFESKDGESVGFKTSFLVKMGDETEFTSSLEREHLTGVVSK